MKIDRKSLFVRRRGVLFPQRGQDLLWLRGTAQHTPNPRPRSRPKGNDSWPRLVCRSRG